MCDYSLHSVETRPAKVDDVLISTGFANYITRGFAAVGEPAVAVCLLPGTELAFEREVEVDHGFRTLLPGFGFGHIDEHVARFRQVDVDRFDTHHDALEFPSGKIVMLTRLVPGQRATVLQLPVGMKPELPPAPDLEQLRDQAPEASTSRTA
jgi:hypothetical protein